MPPEITGFEFTFEPGITVGTGSLKVTTTEGCSDTNVDVHDGKINVARLARESGIPVDSVRSAVMGALEAADLATYGASASDFTLDCGGA